MATYHNSRGTPSDPSQDVSVRIKRGYRGCCDCTPPEADYIQQTIGCDLTKVGFRGYVDKKYYRQQHYTHTYTESSSSESTSPNGEEVTTYNSSRNLSASATFNYPSDFLQRSFMTNATYTDTTDSVRHVKFTRARYEDDGNGGLIFIGNSVTDSYTINHSSSTYDRPTTGFVDAQFIGHRRIQYKRTGYTINETNYSGVWPGGTPTDTYDREDWIEQILSLAVPEDPSYPIISETVRELEDDVTDYSNSYVDSWGHPVTNSGSSRRFRKMVLSNEYTDEELEDHIDAALEFSWPVDINNTKIFLGVTATYYPPIYRAAYSDDYNFEAAKTARTALAQSFLTSAENRLSDSETNKANAESNLASILAARTSSTATFNTNRSAANAARQNWTNLRQQYYAALNKRDYATDLTPAEQADLTAQVNALSPQVNTARLEYESARSFTTTPRNEIIASVTNIRAAQATILYYEAQIANNELAITAAQAFVDAPNDEDYCFQNMNAANYSQAHFTKNLTTEGVVSSVSRRNMRYAIGITTTSSYGQHAVGWFALDDILELNLKWSERTQIYSADATHIERTTNLIVQPSDLFAFTTWRDIIPTESGAFVDLRGPKVADQRSPSTLVAGIVKGGRIYKKGRLQFTASPTPTVYKTLTFSGGFAGCAEKSLPPKTYSGVITNDSGDLITTPLSTDTVAAIAENGWVGRGARFPVYQAFSDLTPPSVTGTGIRLKQPPTVETATTRTWEQHVNCGGVDIVDQFTAQLSTPITTATIRQQVDNAYDNNQTIGTEANAAILYKLKGPGAPWRSATFAAIRTLAADETNYWRVSCALRIRLVKSNNDVTSFNISAPIKRLNLITGALTTVDWSVTVADADLENFWYAPTPGDTNVFPAEPNLEELIWIEDEDIVVTELPTSESYTSLPEVTLV